MGNQIDGQIGTALHDRVRRRLPNSLHGYAGELSNFLDMSDDRLDRAAADLATGLLHPANPTPDSARDRSGQLARYRHRT